MSEYNPIELSKKIEKKAIRDNERKYYRFRKAKFYGGIATADCVGCNLSCHFCWSKKPRKEPENTGEFYSPEEVKDKLTDIAEKHDLKQIRISGTEPTVGRNHLLSLLEKMEESRLKFILETNGILLGNNPGYVESLKKFDDFHVRVSLKGCNEKQFSKLTGSDPKGFRLQIQSLKNLINAGISCHASVLKEFTEGKIPSLMKTLRRIDPKLIDRLEFESLILYPHVRKQLDKAGIKIPQKQSNKK